MKIDHAFDIITPKPAEISGNQLPVKSDNNETNSATSRSYIRELAQSIDPQNMSWQESLDIANALMKAGEGELSTAFLPPPMLHQDASANVTNIMNTPEGKVRMAEKFDMFDSLKSRIAYREQNNLSTDILHNALEFLNKLDVAKSTVGINSYV